jgi:hypothetical protein
LRVNRNWGEERRSWCKNDFFLQILHQTTHLTRKRGFNGKKIEESGERERIIN